MSKIAGLDVGMPTTIDEVTPAWMTTVLRTSGAIDNTTSVTGLTSAPFAVGVGLLSLLFRSQLDYDDPTATDRGAPGSVIVKMETNVDAQRGVADALQFYQRELRFYRELADDLPVRTPVVHAAMMSSENTDFCLVMEDLSSCEAVDQVTGAGPEAAVKSVRAMARFHAHFWGWDFSELSDTFLPFDNPIYRMALPDIFAAGWGPAKTHGGDLIPDDVRAFGDRFGDLVPYFIDQVGEIDTMIHGDWRADNLLIGEDGEVIVIDFQITGVGAACYDLGYFLSQSIDPDVLRAEQDNVVDAYFDELASAGIEVDRAYQERVTGLSVAWCLIYAVTSFVSWEELPHQSRHLMRSMLDRSVQAIVSSDALSLLPDGGSKT